MEFKHIPVLYKEVIGSLDIKPDGVYIDGTVGGGGHSEGICRHLSEKGMLIAVDRDIEALRAAEERLKPFSCRKKFIHTNYSDVDGIFLESGKADGILLDIGVSSFQLDTAERGFSYMHDAPMDMRMDADENFTAYDVVNEYSEKELFRVIKEYGEERWASRIASFIVRERRKAPITNTLQLVDIIKAAIPAGARREGPHPAKRTFQAIRIEVNGELDHLKKAVKEFPDILSSGGRFSVITFHSLEDRIVKEEFNRRLDPCICPKNIPVCVCGRKADVKRITRKPITASEDELEKNPRSRSAKLRVIEKL